MKSELLDEIYKKYYKELYLYALSLCRDEELAKDLVGETFFKALIASNHPAIQKESFKFWLFRILKNHYIDQLRKENESVTIEKHTPFLADAKTLEPLKRNIQNERNQRLYHHLIHLEPVVYREVLFMYYFSNLTIREIALTINRTETNAKTILYRARKKLGKLLKEDSYEF